MTAAQKRGLVFLALALCVVSALLWLPAREEREHASAQSVFPGIEAAGLTRIVFQRGTAAPVTLERDGEAWRIAAPQPIQADTWRAESMASALAGLQALAPLHGANPGDLGLETDRALRIEFETLDGVQHSLLVGDEAPAGGGTYIQIAAEVRVAQGSLPSPLDTTLEALRTRQLWQVAPSEASFVAVERGELRLEAVRGDDGWHDGSGRPLDNDGVAAWLSSLAGLRAVAFGPPPGPLDPRGRIEVRVGDEPGQVLSAGQVVGTPEMWWQGSTQATPVTLDDRGLEAIEEGVRLLEAPPAVAPPS